MPEITAEDGTRLFYQLDGAAAGPVLMLANALGTTLEMWDAQARAFGQEWRVLRYDARGHGRSAAPPGPYSIERLGRDALALLDALRIERAAFCGLSMGGMVGQWLGANAGARLERLALACTAAHMAAPEVWDQRIEAVRAQGMAAIVPGVLERWFTGPFRARSPEAVAGIAAMLNATDPEGYVACCAAVRGMDQRAALGAIAVPTLVIAGRHDQATPPEQGRRIAEAIPGARLVELDAAHLANVEAAAAFNEALRAFLQG